MTGIQRMSEDHVADRWEIHDLTNAYADAVDEHDWRRFEALFTKDARIDYREAGGIAGTPAELAAWMPQAMRAFTWSLHSMSTHTVCFDDATTARGTLHVLARHGVDFEGAEELMDVGAIYQDLYVRTDGGWRFRQRIERTKYIVGGRFADLVRKAAENGR